MPFASTRFCGHYPDLSVTDLNHVRSTILLLIPGTSLPTKMPSVLFCSLKVLRKTLTRPGNDFFVILRFVLHFRGLVFRQGTYPSRIVEQRPHLYFRASPGSAREIRFPNPSLTYN